MRHCCACGEQTYFAIAYPLATKELLMMMTMMVMLVLVMMPMLHLMMMVMMTMMTMTTMMRMMTMMTIVQLYLARTTGAAVTSNCCTSSSS